MLTRRGFLRGMGGILAAAAARAFIRNAMPIRRLDGLTEFVEPVDVSVPLRNYIGMDPAAGPDQTAFAIWREAGIIQIFAGAMPPTADSAVDPASLLATLPWAGPSKDDPLGRRAAGVFQRAGTVTYMRYSDFRGVRDVSVNRAHQVEAGDRIVLPPPWRDVV